MSIPELTYHQKICISVADQLITTFDRISLMSSDEINDVLLMLEPARRAEPMAAEAWDSLLDMVRILRADAEILEDRPIVIDKGVGAK